MIWLLIDRWYYRYFRMGDRRKDGDFYFRGNKLLLTIYSSNYLDLDILDFIHTNTWLKLATSFEMIVSTPVGHQAEIDCFSFVYYLYNDSLAIWEHWLPNNYCNNYLHDLQTPLLTITHITFVILSRSFIAYNVIRSCPK